MLLWKWRPCGWSRVIDCSLRCNVEEWSEMESTCGWSRVSDRSLRYNVAGWSPSWWWRLHPLMQLQFSFHNYNPWQITTTSLSSIIFRQILLEGQEKEALQRYGKAPDRRTGWHLGGSNFVFCQRRHTGSVTETTSITCYCFKPLELRIFWVFCGGNPRLRPKNKSDIRWDHET